MKVYGMAGGKTYTMDSPDGVDAPKAGDVICTLGEDRVLSMDMVPSLDFVWTDDDELGYTPSLRVDVYGILIYHGDGMTWRPGEVFRKGVCPWCDLPSHGRKFHADCLKELQKRSY